MILVTGATGKVGGEAVRLLADRGVPVRAFVRDGAKAAPLGAAGAEIAVGDLGDPASIDAAMTGVGAVVLVSPGQPDQEGNVVESARRAGVGHVVYVTSTAGADSPVARRRWKAQVEAVLADSGVPSTLLRANAFMQNTLALAPAIARTGGFGSSAGSGRVGMVDSRDVAAVAATVARDPARHAGATYRLTGPEAIPYAEVARVLGDLLGHPVTFTTTTPEQDRAAMIAAGVPEPVATMNAQAFGLIAQGDADWTSDDVEEVTGRPPRSYRRFATDHLAAFRG